MTSEWQIVRDTKIGLGPAPIAKGVSLEIEPVPGDVLILTRPDENLEGSFEVLRRVISAEKATLVVTPYEEQPSTAIPLQKLL